MEIRTLLAVALVVIGAISTSVAFGGATWREGPEPLVRRINRRGWISLCCLGLGVSVAIAKEVNEGRLDARRDRDMRAAAATANTEHLKEVTDADEKRRSDKVEADKRQQELREKLANANAALLSTRAITDEVSSSLTSARDDLTQQSMANVVTAFANANQSISNMLFYLPLTQKAQVARDVRHAFLPSFDNPACRDLTGLQVLLAVGVNKFDRLVYYPGDDRSEHQYFSGSFPKYDGLVRFDRDELDVLSGVQRLTGQKSTNRVVYEAGLHPRPGVPISAAELYVAAMRSNSAVAVVQMTWVTLFKTKGDEEFAKKTYPSIITSPVLDPNGFGETVEDERVLMDPDKYLDVTKRSPYPSDCSRKVQAYFRNAFSKAALLVTLNQKQNEAMLFRLKAQPPVYHDGIWSVNFKVDSTPQFQILDDTSIRMMANWFSDDDATP